jgi:hypothetical protein
MRTENPPQNQASLPSTDRATAKSQLHDALASRGIEIHDRRAGDGIWIHEPRFEKHEFWVRGGMFDGTVVIDPRRKYRRSGWKLRTDISMFFAGDLATSEHANAAHEAAASRLRTLEFTGEMQPTSERYLAEGRQDEYRGSQWVRVVDSVAEAAEVILGVLAIRCEIWPAHTAEPVVRACPVIRATGDFYWIPPVVNGGAWRLVGPEAELAASVRATGHWFVWDLSGDPIDCGEGATVDEAKRFVELLARAHHDERTQSGHFD